MLIPSKYKKKHGKKQDQNGNPAEDCIKKKTEAEVSK